MSHKYVESLDVDWINLANDTFQCCEYVISANLHFLKGEQPRCLVVRTFDY
jgi:hypothetical protein